MNMQMEYQNFEPKPLTVIILKHIDRYNWQNNVIDKYEISIDQTKIIEEWVNVDKATLWNQPKLLPGTIVEFSNHYCKEFNGQLELNLSKGADLRIIDKPKTTSSVMDTQSKKITGLTPASTFQPSPQDKSILSSDVDNRVAKSFETKIPEKPDLVPNEPKYPDQLTHPMLGKLHVVPSILDNPLTVREFFRLEQMLEAINTKLVILSEKINNLENRIR